MTRILIRHNDGHNEPRVDSYASLEEAATKIASPYNDGPDAILEALREEGEYSDGDRWTQVSLGGLLRDFLEHSGIPVEQDIRDDGTRVALRLHDGTRVRLEFDADGDLVGSGSGDMGTDLPDTVDVDGLGDTWTLDELRELGGPAASWEDHWVRWIRDESGWTDEDLEDPTHPSWRDVFGDTPFVFASSGDGTVHAYRPAEPGFAAAWHSATDELGGWEWVDQSGELGEMPDDVRRLFDL